MKSLAKRYNSHLRIYIFLKALTRKRRNSKSYRQSPIQPTNTSWMIRLLLFICFFLSGIRGVLTIGRKIHPNPPLVRGGGVDFETILPSVESLWSSQQGEVYFMGGGAARDRHLGFYQELEIRLKSREMVIFCTWHVKYHMNKHFASFCSQVLLLVLKIVEKTYIFTQKWLDHLRVTEMGRCWCFLAREGATTPCCTSEPRINTPEDTKSETKLTCFLYSFFIA